MDTHLNKKINETTYCYLKMWKQVVVNFYENF